MKHIGSQFYLVKVGERGIKIHIDHILKNNTNYRQHSNYDDFMFCELADSIYTQDSQLDLLINMVLTYITGEKGGIDVYITDDYLTESVNIRHN